MRWTTITAGLAAAAAFGALSLPAQAQYRERTTNVVQSNPQGTVMRWQDENGRVRTRILVERRSYLDGGTEVLPGERKYHDYAYPPGYSVTQVIDGTAFSRDKQTLPGPFDLPGKNNPMQW